MTRVYTARGQLATLAVDSVTIDTQVYDNGGRMISRTIGGVMSSYGFTAGYDADDRFAFEMQVARERDGQRY